jgi:beta-alanine--pyruvate transaminase
VIVEAIAGSTGVLLPPKGYLERLRAICDSHGILLIFDEVITGFGRLGAPFAVDFFGVVPDLVTSAKGLTNGAIPMGAVFATRAIYDILMQGREGQIELFHGYTYSGHPAACAAGITTLEIYQEEGLLTRAAAITDRWQNALHSLRGLPHVTDIRALGLVAGIELTPRPGHGGARGYETFLDCYERGVLIRYTGDVLALSPPLIVSDGEIDQIVDTIAGTLKRLT